LTYEQTATLTTLISAAQGVSFADESKIRIWYSLLEDLEFELAHLALKKLLRTEMYSITPAHIRAACADLAGDSPDVAAAVELVFDALRNYGRYNWEAGMERIENGDPIAFSIVKAIGYFNLCNGNTEYTRPEFVRFYREAAAAYRVEKVMPQRLLLQIGEYKARLERSDCLPSRNRDNERSDCFPSRLLEAV
jgi:hypothetical protein